jgi:CoA:oxalate CoA-transferase
MTAENESAERSQGPLAGLLVVDCTRVLAGPYCTMMLADLGARVIKVERPGGGDDSRRFPPFIEQTGDSGYFMSINRRKESLALDFGSEAGRKVLLELCDRADILVENFSAGTLERKGFGPDVLQQRNPRLIIGRVSGFGQSGPDFRAPAYDITVQARSGLMSITGPESGEPVKIGSAISDIGGGLFCAIGVLSAVYERSVSGRGQVVDIGMLDASVALLENSIVRHSIGGMMPAPIGQRHPSITPFDGYRCKDGTMVIAAGNDGIFKRLGGVLKRPLHEDPRFADNEARTENQAALKAEIEAVTAEHPVSYWLPLMKQAQVPASKIQNIADVTKDPQVLARKLVAEYPHPAGGQDFAIVGSPFQHFSRTPGLPSATAPRLGEHTDAVLEGVLGYSKEMIETLRKANVIA